MPRGTYHHGDLRRALIDATTNLIEQVGTSGFSLRKVAREADVSPAAPSHHFGDSRGLLTAVAIEGFQKLVENFEAIDSAAEPYDRLLAHARTYVDLSLRYPGHRAVMFRDDLIDKSDPAYLAIAPRAFELISAAVADVMAEAEAEAGRSGGAADRCGTVDSDCATRTVWATCHGIADLYGSRVASLGDDPELSQLVDHATAIVYFGITGRRPARPS
jgi:AcrR family transcriptional regulator